MPDIPDDVARPRTRRQLRAAGWSDGRIGRALRSGTIERFGVGTYRPGGAADSDRARAQAAHEHFGSDTVMVLGTAARLHGLPEPWPDDGRTHVALAPGREQHQRAGFRIHTWKLRPDEITVLHGLLTTSVARTLRDLMCTVDRFSAVSALDAALHLAMVTEDEVRDLARTTTRRRGAARSRSWWTEGDGRSESPLETRVRLRAVDGGYPPDDLQREFVVRGRRYRTDFSWMTSVGRTLIGEADGRTVHEKPEALLHDRTRANDLVATGDVDLVRFTWADTLTAEPVPATLGRILGPPRAA